MAMAQRLAGQDVYIQYLRTNFFSAVAVERPEIQDVLELMKHQALIVLKGERGCGKTTGLLAIETLLSLDQEDNSDIVDRQFATKSVHYFNFKDHEKELSPPPDGGRRRKVCDVVLELIINDLRDLYHVTTLREAWSQHRVMAGGTEPHERIRGIAEAAFGTAWVEAPLERIKELGLLPEWARAELAFGEHDGTAKLRQLLEFFTAELNHHVVLLIDNTDQYAAQLQADLINELRTLADQNPALLSPVIAVRPQTYHRAETEAEGDSVTFFKAIHPIELSSRDTTIVKDYIKRRFAVVQILDDAASAYDEEEVALLARELGLPSSARLHQLHSDFLAAFFSEVGSEHVLKALIRCHNGSLRHVGMTLINLVNTIVLDRDPLFRYGDNIRRSLKARDMVAAGAQLAQNDRVVRTFLYRYMIFFGRRPPREMVTTDLFKDKFPRGSQSISFVDMRLLQYLALRSGRERATAGESETVEWGTIVADLGTVGIDESDLLGAIRRLTNPRQGENTGLVRADIRLEKLNREAPGRTTRIDILPSGNMVLDTLSLTCEYIFWSAMSDPDGSSYLPPSLATRDEILPVDIQSEAVRAETAINYLVDVILKAHITELEDMRGGSARQRWDRYKELFVGERTQDAYPARAAGALKHFVTDRASTIEPNVQERLTKNIDRATERWAAEIERVSR